MPVRPASPDSTNETYTEYPQDSSIDGFQPYPLQINTPQYNSYLSLQRPKHQRSHHRSTMNLHHSPNTPQMGINSIKHRQMTRSTPDLHLQETGVFSIHSESAADNAIDDYRHVHRNRHQKFNYDHFNNHSLESNNTRSNHFDSDSDLSRRTGDGEYGDSNGFMVNGYASSHIKESIENDHLFNVNTQFHKYRISTERDSGIEGLGRNKHDMSSFKPLPIDLLGDQKESQEPSSSEFESSDDLDGLDELDDVISKHQSQQLLPRSQDLVMMERPLQLPSQNSGSKSKKGPPRSKLGVLALQAEALATPAGQEFLRQQEHREKLMSSQRTRSHTGMYYNN